MKGRTARLEATHRKTLTPLKEHCEECGQLLYVGYHSHRTVTRLDGLWALRIVVRRCVQPECPRYRLAYRPEEEGNWALPHGEFGLEVIALIGHLRFCEHRSVPEMHRALLARGVSITERSVTNLMQHYEELIALRVADQQRIGVQLQQQGRIILAIDGLQPDVGHEVLWVLRDCISGEILLARPLLSSTHDDLTALLSEVKTQLAPLDVPVKGIISDGQETIGSAVAVVFPTVPHQRCQFHYLKDAVAPLYEADRHAKTQLKTRVRGVRPLERALENQQDPQAEAARGYCLAVRSALTDDGRAPLEASGLKLQERLTLISDSLARVSQKKPSASTDAIAAHPHQGIAGHGGFLAPSQASL